MVKPEKEHCTDTNDVAGNPCRFDMLEGLGAGIEDHIDLKEVYILQDGDTGF